MVLSRYYTVTLTCGFELELYPFDHQECPIELEVPFERATHMELTMVNPPTVDDSIKFLQYQCLCSGLKWHFVLKKYIWTITQSYQMQICFEILNGIS